MNEEIAGGASSGPNAGQIEYWNAVAGPKWFAYADADRVRHILTGAGFANTVCEGIDQTLLVGGGGELDRTVEFLLQLGPLGALLREAGEATRSAVAGAVHHAVAGYVTPEGVRMDAAAWLVTGVA